MPKEIALSVPSLPKQSRGLEPPGTIWHLAIRSGAPVHCCLASLGQVTSGVRHAKSPGVLRADAKKLVFLTKRLNCPLNIGMFDADSRNGLISVWAHSHYTLIAGHNTSSLRPNIHHGKLLGVIAPHHNWLHLEPRCPGSSIGPHSCPICYCQ